MITRLCRQVNRSNQRWTRQQKRSPLIPVRCIRIILPQTRMGAARFAVWILCLSKKVHLLRFRAKAIYYITRIQWDFLIHPPCPKKTVWGWTIFPSMKTRGKTATFVSRLKCSKQWVSEQPLYLSQTLIKPCARTAQSSRIHGWSLWRPPVLKAGSMT